ncbi:MAG: hypothetical protein LLG14_04780 [Nocardiaceae bacterium]|nr:hypothetical protein [Nocardiaceae bacterium]
MTESTSVAGKVALGGFAAAAVVVLVGVDAWNHSSPEKSSSASAESTTTTAAPVTPTCGNPRTVTVEGSTPVVWELVRVSDSATSACPRVTLYKDKAPVSNFELPAGVTFLDGDDALFSYRDGLEAKAEDQTVPNSNLSGVWLIARTSDGQTVSANLADGQLKLG